MGDFIGIVKKNRGCRAPEISSKFAATSSMGSATFSYDISFDLSIFQNDKAICFMSGFLSNIAQLRRRYKLEKCFGASLIAQLYAANRENFHLDLDGNFSICLYDKINDHTIILRDKFGSRPIYFMNESNFFAVSTSLGLLVKSNLAPMSLNKEAFMDFMLFQSRNCTNTFYTEINRLDPTYLIRIKDGIVLKSKISTKLPKKNRWTAIRNPIERFSEIFKQSIQKSDLTDKNIGIMLSGGLDSSAISVAIKNIGFKNVKTFSANFTHLPEESRDLSDETKFQKAVSSSIGYKHIFCSLENVLPLKSVQSTLDYYDEPTHFPNVYLWDVIYDAAKDNGIEVMVTGQDGDNVISYGNHRFPELLKNMQFFTFWYEVAKYSKMHNQKFFRVLKFILREIAIKWGYKSNPVINYSIIKDSIFFDENLRFVSNQTLVDSHQENLSSPMHPLTFEWRYLYFKNKGIEVRSPFYSEDLISFCLSLPSRWKLRHGMTRYILRQYLRGKVPDCVSNRALKANLTHGLGHNLASNDISALERELKNIHPLMNQFIDLKKLISVMDELKKSKSTNQVSSLQTQIMNAFSFYIANQWLHRNDKLISY